LGCAGPPAGPPTTWADSLPENAQAAILWAADVEEGDLSDWYDYENDEYYSGGGVFTTPSDPGGMGDEAAWTAEASTTVAHSGSYSAEATIRDALRAENGNRAVRLMRWTDKPWDRDGRYFPTSAYYSTWMYFPRRYDPGKVAPWDPGDGGWWNVFQFKSDNEAGVSNPIVVVNIALDNSLGEMVFYVSEKIYDDQVTSDHTLITHEQEAPIALPTDRWFHVEAFYRRSVSGEGAFTLRQDGILLFELSDITTALTDEVSWGIGNYTDHVQAVDSLNNPVGDPGTATIYFDDAVVATAPMHPYASP
jgi:hypothetical protein